MLGLMEMFCMTISMFMSLLQYCTMVLQDVTTERNWVMDIRDLSALFLTTAHTSTMISKFNLSYLKLGVVSSQMTKIHDF